jgi:hypothetical protein
LNGSAVEAAAGCYLSGAEPAEGRQDEGPPGGRARGRCRCRGSRRGRAGARQWPLRVCLTLCRCR